MIDRRNALAALVRLAGIGALFRWAPPAAKLAESNILIDPVVKPPPPPLVLAPGEEVFMNVEIGGGGFVTAGMSSRSGRWEVCGTDTATSFVRRPGERWRPALVALSIPDMANFPGVADTSDGKGSYTQAIADNGVAYTSFRGYLIRSDDAFQSRARVILGPKRMFENRGPQRLWNSKMAIDQTNPDRLVIGCMGGGDLGGAYYSLDGGATPFVRISGVPDPMPLDDQILPILVAVDPNNPQRWALSILGHGIYISTSGPAGPYSLSVGSPTDGQDMHYDNFGRLWVVKLAGPRGTSISDPIYSLENGAWKAEKLTQNAALKSLAINPRQRGQIVAIDPNGVVHRTIKNDDGVWKWADFENNIYPTKQPHHSPDRLWQDTTGSHHNGLFPSRVEFDPIIANRVNFYHGTGTGYFEPPAKWGGIEFWDTTAGIEQIVCNGGLSYVGGDHWLFGWDKGAWKFSDFRVPAVRHYPESVQFTHTWDMDVSPSRNVVVMLNNSAQSAGHQSAYSINKGPFKLFANQHPGEYRLGGCIAAFSDDAFLWVPFNNGRAVYTLDRGETPWNYVDLGVPMPADGQESGWSFAMYFKKICVVASKETPGRGWLFNYGPTGFESLRGVYRTENGPAGPWRKVFSGAPGGHHFILYHHATLKEVPGHANFLLLSGGSAPDHNEPLMGSRDGGVTWKAVGSGVAGVTDFSFGKPLPGATYPVLRFAGRVKGVDGVFEITDLDKPRIELVTEHPAGMVTDHLRAISGDMNVYGKWAYGYGGSGWRGSMKSPLAKPGKA